MIQPVMSMDAIARPPYLPGWWPRRGRSQIAFDDYPMPLDVAPLRKRD